MNLEIFIQALTPKERQQLKSLLETTQSDISNQSVSILKCHESIRVQNVFKCYGIETIGQLTQYSRRDLNKLRGFGFGSAQMIVDELNNMGIKTKVDYIK